MSATWIVPFGVFLAATGLGLVASWLVVRRNRRADSRLEALAEPSDSPRNELITQFAQATLPTIGSPLLPDDQHDRTLLRNRLIHAGLYAPQALTIFLGVKMLLILGPALVATLAVLLSLVSPTSGLMWGAVATSLGMIAPGLWLDYRKAQRQIQLRRSLPDALDVIVICVEGGLSLRGALRRVVSELWSVHPLLAGEMDIVEREVYLGRLVGEALQQFANRSDLEEIRSLASVISQSERFGTSIVKTLTVYADMLRVKRQQRAEEMAHKAATKILFPTLLLIFPAFFVVILGPAAIQLWQLFQLMQ